MTTLDRLPSVVVSSLLVFISVLLVREVIDRPVPNGRHDKNGIGEAVLWLKDAKYVPSKTVLIVLRVGCQFCAKSAPFYRRVIEQSKRRQDIQLIAVMESPLMQSDAYLLANRLRFQNVRQADPETLGIEGTPAILILDQHGIVRHSWLGLLNGPAEEAALKEVFN